MYVAYNLRPNWLPSSKVPQGLLAGEDFLGPYNQQIDIFVVAGSVVCITCFIPQINLSKAAECFFFPGSCFIDRINHIWASSLLFQWTVAYPSLY